VKEDEPKRTRTTDFIRTEEGKIYLPRPKGWMHGMGLQNLFRKTLNEQIHIASPEYWETLKRDNKMLTLLMISDTEHKVIVKP
tara:strand:+ start:537 stop:785 length:249 start_codon:yes stop_codon:yes gene_type:complete